ncbi:Barstar (barnase inhibitor) [Nocardia amikacinitolerans]|uniref:barstar family protein n=1 Tax=Nocardia amikacinitolerans TaxID=756689 RepID=UPI00082FD4CD|nr:barstar family protein [Nocardia amikacinitolerans]MCP2318937.1 Barstar (barnase inhibitor) [Nocardia amikacinitolerans]
MTRPVPLSRFLARTADGAPSALGGSSAPVLGALPVDAPELSEVRYRAPAGYLVRELRGPKMRGTAGVFDEWAAAFQFPYYFGANKDAFDECLRDLDDFVGNASGYVVVVRDAAALLADQPDERDWFEAAMRDCADYWARRDVAFRVVYQGAPPSGEFVPLTLA